MIRAFSALGARDRRALLVGGGVLVAALAFRSMLTAVDALGVMRQRNQVRADLLARIETRPAVAILGDSLHQLETALDSARGRLLPRGTDASVASNLHAAVRRAATDVGLVLHSTRAESDASVAGPFAAASVRLDAEGDVSAVMQFLLILELAPGALRFTEMSVTPLEPAAGDDRPEAIRLSITVSGIAPRTPPGREEARDAAP